mmetsp:Transcript_84314/g.236160  ORF Transcript_84314/g.236160 Transcript_84314/m.236160 type:complete len:391 (-) Transcript_84314:63-1235(-)
MGTGLHRPTHACISTSTWLLHHLTRHMHLVIRVRALPPLRLIPHTRLSNLPLGKPGTSLHSATNEGSATFDHHRKHGGHDGARQELEQKWDCEDPDRLDGRRDRRAQNRTDAQDLTCEVEEAGNSPQRRHGQAGEADLCHVLEVDRHRSRNEDDIDEGHGEVHGVVDHILQKLHPHKAASRPPEAAAHVVEALLDWLASREHDDIQGKHAACGQDSLDLAWLVSDLGEQLEDATTGVEAEPVAWDEDEGVSEHAVVHWAGLKSHHPPTGCVMRDRLRPRPRLPRTKALPGARQLGTRLPTDVEVHEGREQDEDLGCQKQVCPLKAKPMRRTERDPRVSEDRQKPHRPIEVEEQPQPQEERLTVGQAVGPRSARVIKTTHECQGCPTAPPC